MFAEYRSWYIGSVKSGTKIEFFRQLSYKFQFLHKLCHEFKATTVMKGMRDRKVKLYERIHNQTITGFCAKIELISHHLRIYYINSAPDLKIYIPL